MFRKAALLAALLLAVASVATNRALAQEATTSKSSDKPTEKVPESEKVVHAYRLDLSVNEMEDGKKINTRQYSMNLNADDSPNDLKIGTRVPVELKQGEFQYVDVGTNISCRIQERADGLQLFVRTEVSNFAVPDQQAGSSTHPLLRQLAIRASTVALLGKPIVVGSVDDPNSKREFQVEVTATRLR